MNEQLRIRLGEYLLSEGIRFDTIRSVEIDPETGTLDISYESDSRQCFHEMSSEIDTFLEFLVTGGK